MFERVSRYDSKKLTLVVVPYAGGSSYGFSSWYKEFERDYNLICLDYAGHGERFKEKLATDFESLYLDIVDQLSKLCIESTVLFGHSMGGLVCGHVAEEIFKRYGRKFKGVIISSCKAPNYFGEKEKKNINDSELKKYLIEERNVPEEIVNSEEFLEYIYPAIKNDYRILNNYVYKDLTIPSCSVYCICAKNDKNIDISMMNDWDNYVENNIVVHEIMGSHFYFEEYPAETFTLISSIILNIMNSAN